MENLDNFDGLYSGTWLLKDKDAEHYFGTVCAFGPAKSAGAVRLSFRSEHIQWETDEYGNMIIDLSEQRARQLADQLFVSLIQLDHLRNLKRLGLLVGEDDAVG